MRCILTSTVFSLASLLSAQTLYVEDFEGASSFTLNTTDVGSTSGVSNTWLLNDVFAGGSGTADCSGFPLDFSIDATPAQPAGITSTNGTYLHVSSLVAVDNGIECCSFGAADGFCTLADDVFARMTSDISTTGFSNVELRFWWLCNGGNQNYGEVYYSVNGGTDWTQLTAPITQYRNVSTWTEQTIDLAAFAGQSTLRFGFRFHNAASFLGGADPGFAIDDVRIIAQEPTNNIACAALGTAFCAGTQMDVPYTIVGTFDGGNVFIAQLSDALGSFASPTPIGTLISTTAGIISCIIPSNTPAGSGYRVRVISTSPAIVGADNGTDLTISAPWNAGNSGALTVCSSVAPINLFGTLSGQPDVNGTWTDPNGQPFPGTFDPNFDPPGCYTFIVSGGGCPSDSSQACITVTTAPDAGLSGTITLCDDAGPYDLFNALGGTPTTGGTWLTGGGTFPGIFTPGSDEPGIYQYVVQGAAPCGSATASVMVMVEPCAGIDQVITREVGLRWIGSDHAGAWLEGTVVSATTIDVFDARGMWVSTEHMRSTGPRFHCALPASAGLYLVVLRSTEGAACVRVLRSLE